MTHLEHIKKFIEATMPSEVIDGAYGTKYNHLLTGKGGGHRWIQSYLQKHWTGEEAINAVEVAIGKPNSICIQYRYDRKGRHPLNAGVIGARSLNEFIKDWLAPYLWEYGYDHKYRDDEPIKPWEGIRCPDLGELISANLK
ncbi:MAG TPA: hypothetical protein EYQ21_00160 [Flavobacteriales bacterium]|nr:hypothetical protein [Flavobacteriales bacterium]